MGKNNNYRYLTETKTKKKLYKAKKLWLVAGLATMGFAGYQAMQPSLNVNADTIHSAASNSNTESSSTSTATSSAMSAASTTTQLSDSPSSSTTNTTPSSTTGTTQSSTATLKAPQTSTETNQTTNSTTTSTAPQTSTQTSQTDANDAISATSNTSNHSDVSEAPTSNATTTSTNATKGTSDATTSAQVSSTPVSSPAITSVNATTNTSTTTNVSSSSVNVKISSNATTSVSSATTTLSSATVTSSATNINQLSNANTGSSQVSVTGSYQSSSTSNAGPDNGTNKSTTSNETTSANAETESAKSLYSDPVLDMQIQLANQSISDLLRSQNNDVDDSSLLRSQNATAYLTSNRPTTIKTTVGNDASGDTWDFPNNTVNISTVMAINSNNAAASPYKNAVQPTYFEQAFQNDIGGNAPIGDVSTINNMVLHIKYADGTTKDLSVSNPTAYVGTGYNISTNSFNSSSPARMAYDSYTTNVTDSNGNTTSVNPLGTPRSELGNTVTYEDVNVAKILSDNNITTPFSIGDTLTLTMNQATNNNFASSYSNTNKPIKSSNTTTQSNTYVMPLKVNFVDTSGNTIAQSQYITSDDNNTWNDGDSLTANITSPTNWLYTGTSSEAYTGSKNGSAINSAVANNNRNLEASSVNNGASATVNGYGTAMDSSYKNMSDEITLVYKKAISPIIVNPDNPLKANTPVDTTNDPNGNNENPSNLSKTVTQTINYVDAVTGATVAPPNTQNIKFGRTLVIDQNSGKELGWSADGSTNVKYALSDGDKAWNVWSPSTSNTTTTVASPDLSAQGYGNPDQSSITGIQYAYNSSNNTITVKYPHTNGIYTPEQATSHGDNPSNLKKTITQTITYNDATTKQPISGVNSNVQSVTYTRNGVYDKVTGQLLGYVSGTDASNPSTDSNAGWSTSNANYGAVNSPDLTNQSYVAPSQAAVAGSTTTAQSTNTVIPVYYDKTAPRTTTKNVTRTIQYQDKQTGATVAPSVLQPITISQTDTVDTVTGQVVKLGTPTSQHHWNSVTSPSLTAQGYAAPDKAIVEAIPDNQATNDKTTTVLYDHSYRINTDNTAQDTRQITRTINYLDADNNNAPVAQSVIQTGYFKRLPVIDNVTGQQVGYSLNGDPNSHATTDGNQAWIPAEESLNAVTSPDLTNKGYRPQTDNASTMVVTPNSNKGVVNIYYHHQNEFVGPNSGHNPGDKVNPNDPNSVQYPDAIGKDQLQKDIVRNIHYTDAETGQTVAPNATQDVTYTRMAVIDKVTGKVIGYSLGNTRKVDLAADDGDNAWQSDDNQWAKLISPDLTAKGYQAQTINALTQSVRVTDSNATLTIPYKHAITSANYGDNYVAGQPINPNDPNGAKWPSGVDKGSLYKTITRTIHYVDGNTGKPLAKDTVETVNYYRTAIVDKVTGKLLGYSMKHDGQVDLAASDSDKAWQSDNNLWAANTAPSIDGYQTPTDALTEAYNVAYDQGDANVTIKYYPVAKSSTPVTPSSAPAKSYVNVSTTTNNYYPASSATAPTTPDLDDEPTTPVKPTPKVHKTTPVVKKPVVKSATPSSVVAQPSSAAQPVQSQAQPSVVSQAPSSVATQAPSSVATQAPSSVATQAPSAPVLTPTYHKANKPLNELPQTGESKDAAILAEIGGMLVLAFAEILRRKTKTANKKR